MSFGLPDRRIAQWQSASKHTEEVAAFNSCSAYQTSPHILFLCHCVPNPPDKGERIRAFHLLSHLAERYRVHLVCFAKREAELEAARALAGRCESVYAELLPRGATLAKAGLRFLCGGSLATSYYLSHPARARVAQLRGYPLVATVAYSAAVACYAPDDIPLLLDMVDVDSEKWLQYASVRRPGFLYRIEGRRLRAVEVRLASRAERSVFSTAAEERLFQTFEPGAKTSWLENGVDFDFFDPSLDLPMTELRARRFVTFLGAMDYYPNADAACWFAERVFPALRTLIPDLEFFVVGRNPQKAVSRLAARPGITVTGAVTDVRPYIAFARALVAPLRIARGIQNKVLESLAMGKAVFVSEAIAATFGPKLPAGVFLCRSEQEMTAAMEASVRGPSTCDASIRALARERFTWNTNLSPFLEEVKAIAALARSPRIEAAPVRDGRGAGVL